MAQHIVGWQLVGDDERADHNAQKEHHGGNRDALQRIFDRARTSVGLSRLGTLGGEVGHRLANGSKSRVNGCNQSIFPGLKKALSRNLEGACQGRTRRVMR
jgi:hypothetical protein